MIEIVIIGQNEGEHIQSMFNALQEYPYPRMWVLDRCTDNSEAQLQEIGERYLLIDSLLTSRQTSHARNLGLAACVTDSDVLFLDGDRYPVSGTLSGLENWEKDIALLMLEKDGRDVIEDYKEVYGGVMNGFYSCGLFIKSKALGAIRLFQDGAVFSTALQDCWGIEDTYLGDVCYHLGLSCDIYRDVRLRGEFDKTMLDSLDAIERRFRKREALNVKW